MIDNLSLYSSFVTVAKCGSLSAASKQLFISQPALTIEIRSLESKLGVQLFHRTSRGMRLTDEGQIMFDYASKALNFIEAGEEKLKDVTDLNSGQLRIGASDMTMRFFLLDYIERFRAKYPNIRLKITNAPTPSTMAALKNGEIDFGVISDPGEIKYDEFIMTPVKDIHDIFVCPPSNPLAKMKKVTVKMLNTQPLIMLGESTSTRQYVSAQMPDLAAPYLEPTTSDLMLLFSVRGLGIASVVEDFALPYLERGELIKIDLEKEIPVRKMIVARNAKIPLSSAAKRMLDGIVE